MLIKPDKTWVKYHNKAVLQNLRAEFIGPLEISIEFQVGNFQPNFSELWLRYLRIQNYSKPPKN